MHSAIKSEEAKKEFFDSPKVLDEKVEILSDEEVAARRREHTSELVKLFI